MRLRFHREALNEMVDTANFYENKQPGLGHRFDRALESALETILSSPTTWAIYTQNVRKYRLRKFPYSIFYRLDADVVTIVAVMHAKRRPDYWLDRV